MICFVCDVLLNAAPLNNGNDSKILRYKFENFADGGYYYMYELSDGQLKHEWGSQKKIGDAFFLVVHGDYSYVDADGKKYQVSYTSDENGFKSSSEHLPDAGTDVTGPPPSHFLAPNVIATLIG